MATVTADVLPPLPLVGWRVTTGAAAPHDATGSSTALAEAQLVVAAMSRLAGLVQDAESWPGSDRRAVLRLLDRAVDGFGVIRASVLVAESRSGTWQGEGDRSFEAGRARTSRIGDRSAAAQVRQAEHLASVPGVAAAVVDGQITLSHAAVIARLAGTGSPAQLGAVQSDAGQSLLLALARDQDAATFAGSVARWKATIDPDALEAEHQAQRRERFLTMTHTERGTFVKGRLDSITGPRVALALEAASPRPAADDDRDPGQRRADALETIAVHFLAQHDTKPGSTVPTQISVVLSEDTWIAARAHRDRRRAAQPTALQGEPTLPGTHDTGADDAGDTGQAAAVEYPPATLEDGTPVPLSELAAAMCDCEVTRIVIDADSAPLDVGRAQRLFTREQRRAIIARDRECIWPQCHLPARWCEVHHLRWWERDAGPTSADNGALLCSFHHHEVHRRDLTITRLAAGASRSKIRSQTVPAPRRSIALVRYELRHPAGRRCRATGP